jgi:predicted DNA-binding transcriptional regulator YafY
MLHKELPLAMLNTNGQIMPRTFINRFKTIDRLIQKKSTGTSEQLAEKIGVSKRTVFEFINVMKETGAPIYYCRIKKTYCYKEQGYFNISFIRVQ